MIDYDDLIRVPWRLGGRDTSGLDCLGVALIVARRAGVDLPADAVPCDYETQVAATAALADGPPPERWMYLGPTARCATRDGDVILSKHADGYHVSARVGPRLALTASKQYGVRPLPLSRISDVVGVYRPR